jgi:DNA-binding NarL/FixJ family response regulator
MDRIRVLVSDRNPMSCELLSEALRRAKFDVAHGVVTSDQVLEVVKQAPPDVAVINAALQDGSLAGFQVLRQLHLNHPGVRVIMVLEKHEGELIIAAFRGGARGVIFQAEPFTTLAKCIRAVHQGQVWASSRDMRLILEALASVAPLRPVAVNGGRLLTTREEEIVTHVAQGMTNREIAQKLALSENTVKNYLFRVFDKLGVSNRVELVVYCKHNDQKIA